MRRKTIVNISLALFVGIALSSIAQEDSTAAEQEALAKKSQNPVGNLISVPIEYWHHGGGDVDADVFIAKPVYPVTIGDYTLINRFILPYISIDGGDHGLGNMQYQGFVTSASPGNVIWGLGLAAELPTHGGNLGTDKWSAGPSAVILTMPGDWVVGALIQNIWSFAGPSDAPSVNMFTFQYFINYNMADGWYLTSTPVMTANWEGSSGDQWTVPLGGGIGKLQRFGKQPVDFKLQAFSNVVAPDGAADWSAMLSVKFLFPKK